MVALSALRGCWGWYRRIKWSLNDVMHLVAGECAPTEIENCSGRDMPSLKDSQRFWRRLYWMTRGTISALNLGWVHRLQTGSSLLRWRHVFVTLGTRVKAVRTRRESTYAMCGISAVGLAKEQRICSACGEEELLRGAVTVDLVVRPHGRKFGDEREFRFNMRRL